MAVLTTEAVLEGGWIFRVSRDDDDGMWQFHTPSGNQDLSAEDGRIVSLQLIWQLDPSIAEVADLEPGWVAWREGVGRPWRRTMEPAAGPSGRRADALIAWISTCWRKLRGR